MAGKNKLLIIISMIIKILLLAWNGWNKNWVFVGCSVGKKDDLYYWCIMDKKN